MQSYTGLKSRQTLANREESYTDNAVELSVYEFPNLIHPSTA